MYNGLPEGGGWLLLESSLVYHSLRNGRLRRTVEKTTEFNCTQQ